MVLTHFGHVSFKMNKHISTWHMLFPRDKIAASLRSNKMNIQNWIRKHVQCSTSKLGKINLFVRPLKMWEMYINRWISLSENCTGIYLRRKQVHHTNYFGYHLWNQCTKKTENHQERMVANFKTHFIGVWARALVYLCKSISMLFALTISFSPRWNDYKFFHRACENMIWIFNRQNAILYEKEKPKFISKIFVQIINLKLNFQFALIHLWKELPYFLNVCRRLNVFQSFIRWHY